MASAAASKRRKTKAKADDGDAVKGNRSVIVAVRLLRTIAAIDGPAALGEIAAATGMSASRTHRYLAGLIQTGLIEQDASSGKYALGATIVELGLTALGKTDAIKLGSEALTNLTERTGLVSLLSTWGSHGPTIVKWEQGRLNTAVRIREGRNLPLLTTATGRVFLAYLPESDTRPLLDRETELAGESQSKARRAASSRADLLRADVLRHGMGRIVGEENPGLAALSAPVFDHNARLIMAVTIISIIGTFDDAYDGAPARELKACANQLSRRLGAPMPSLRASEQVIAIAR